MTLSKREHFLLEGISNGMTYLDIALRLGISQWTVVGIAKRLYQKLEAKSNCHAVALAIRQGLIN